MSETRVHQLLCGGSGKAVRTMGREDRHGLCAEELGWTVLRIPTRSPRVAEPVRSASCGSDRVDPGRRAASPSSDAGISS